MFKEVLICFPNLDSKIASLPKIIDTFKKYIRKIILLKEIRSVILVLNLIKVSKVKVSRAIDINEDKAKNPK